MPFCSNCGTATDSRFCPQCGAAVGAPPGAPTPGVYAAAPAPVVAAGGLQPNVAAALCYVLGLITGILFLVLSPYNQNPTIRFHAFQSIFLHVAWIVLWIGYTMTVIFLPLPLHAVLSLLSLLLGLGGFLLWLILIWKAYQGEKFVLPIIGPIAEQQVGR